LSCVLAFLYFHVTEAEAEFPPTWFKGSWRGNPQYTPVGPMTNYSIAFRPYNTSTAPPSSVLLETDVFPAPLAGSYQQWWIVANQITYCGLLTFDNGKTYGITNPTFIYEPQLSSDNVVVFGGDPRGGACATFQWVWNRIDDSTINFWVTVASEPHVNVTFSRLEEDDVPVQETHRNMCVYVNGMNNPYNYDWNVNPAPKFANVTWPLSNYRVQKHRYH